MPSPSVIKQTEEALEEVLRIIQQDYEEAKPVLCETDRNKFVEEEGSLREQLKKTMKSESNSWLGFLSFSPQAAKDLKEAEVLRQRVKETIYTGRRIRLTGKSNPSPDLIFNLTSPRMPETDAPLAEGNPEPASNIITSPLNMRCSPSEPGFSETNISSAFQNDHDHTSDINEAINSPLETSSEPSDRSRDSSSRRHRRSPPPPPLHLSPLNIRCFLSEPEVSPLETSSECSDRSRDSSSRRHRRSPPPPPRRTAQSGNSRPLSETSSNPDNDTLHRSHSVRRPAPPPPQSPRQSRIPRSPINVSSPTPGPLPTSSDSDSDTPRRSHSVRRPAPPPPQSPKQSRTPRSPTNVSSFSPGPLPPDLDMSRFAQGMNAFAASMARDLSRQTRGVRCSDSVIKSNCVDISNSNVKGLTMNNNATNCTGAVIHETAMPQRLPRHVPQF